MAGKANAKAQGKNLLDTLDKESERPVQPEES